MRKLEKLTLAAAAVTLLASGAALAREGAKECSLETLRGHYVFSVTGFNIVAGVAQPKAILEFIDLNGDGSLTVPAATHSVNGVFGVSPPGGTGVYTLDATCTGTLAFDGGPSFYIFADSHSDDYYMIQTNPNTVMQGTVVRLSR